MTFQVWPKAFQSGLCFISNSTLKQSKAHFWFVQSENAMKLWALVCFSKWALNNFKVVSESCQSGLWIISNWSLHCFKVKEFTTTCKQTWWQQKRMDYETSMLDSYTHLSRFMSVLAAEAEVTFLAPRRSVLISRMISRIFWREYFFLECSTMR